MKGKQSSKSVVLFCVLILIACPLQLQAQDSQRPGLVYGADRYGQLRNNELLIVNGSTTWAMPFSLKNGENGSYVEFQLKQNGRSTYRNTTHILVKTDNGNTVERRLEYRKRYKIFWNQDRWDVKLITPR